jgi:hypothetical protein
MATREQTNGGQQIDPQSLRLAVTQLRQAMDAFWEQVEALTKQVADEDHATIAPSVKTVREVERKTAARVCLHCGRQTEEGEKYLRGLGECCYHRVYRRLKDGRLSLANLIEQGKITPEPSQGGRPELNRFERADQEAKIADAMEGMKQADEALSKKGRIQAKANRPHRKRR